MTFLVDFKCNMGHYVLVESVHLVEHFKTKNFNMFNLLLFSTRKNCGVEFLRRMRAVLTVLFVKAIYV